MFGTHLVNLGCPTIRMISAIDIRESVSSYIVSAKLSGIKKEYIHVTLQDDILAIIVCSQAENNEEKDGLIIRQERRYRNLL